jgi:hypothetical protein
MISNQLFTRIAALLVAPACTLPGAELSAQAAVVSIGGRPLTVERDGFARVGSVVELPGDSLRVVVQDVGERRIVVVNFRDGSRQQVGHSGGGPREYRNPGRLFPQPNGWPLFQDGRSGKLLRLVEGGRALEEFLLDPRKFGARPLVLGLESAGRVVIRADGLEGGAIDSSAVLSWTVGEEEATKLATMATGVALAENGPGGMTLRRNAATPFAPATAQVVLPNGAVALVSSTPYQVTTIAPNGVRSVGPAFPWQPIPVTAADRAALAQSSAGPPQSGFGGNSTSVPRLPGDPLPTTKPPFSGADAVRVAPDGVIWVAKNRAADDPVPTFDLFSRDRVITRVVRLPAERILLGFGRGVLFLGHRDPATDLVTLERWAFP